MTIPGYAPRAWRTELERFYTNIKGIAVSMGSPSYGHCGRCRPLEIDSTPTRQANGSRGLGLPSATLESTEARSVRRSAASLLDGMMSIRQ